MRLSHTRSLSYLYVRTSTAGAERGRRTKGGALEDCRPVSCISPALCAARAAPLPAQPCTDDRQNHARTRVLRRLPAPGSILHCHVVLCKATTGGGNKAGARRQQGAARRSRLCKHPSHTAACEAHAPSSSLCTPAKCGHRGSVDRLVLALPNFPGGQPAEMQVHLQASGHSPAA